MSEAIRQRLKKIQLAQAKTNSGGAACGGAVHHSQRFFETHPNYKGPKGGAVHHTERFYATHPNYRGPAGGAQVGGRRPNPWVEFEHMHRGQYGYHHSVPQRIEDERMLAQQYHQQQMGGAVVGGKKHRKSAWNAYEHQNKGRFGYHHSVQQRIADEDELAREYEARMPQYGYEEEEMMGGRNPTPWQIFIANNYQQAKALIEQNQPSLSGRDKRTATIRLLSEAYKQAPGKYRSYAL
jgi:hypothetical protein